MNVLIVHAHPNPESFNGALTARAVSAFEAVGCNVEVADLYREDFDPVEGPHNYPIPLDPDHFSPLAEQRASYKGGALPADVSRHIERLESADLLILQFPLWWHGPPAILKGWFDRVFVSGGLYSGRMRYDTGYFRGRRALCSVTTGAPEAAFGPGARGGDMETMLWPVQYSLHYLGFTVSPAFISYGVQGHGYAYEAQTATEDRLRRRLDAWEGRLQTLDGETPLAFPGWADWDDEGHPRRA